MQENVNARRLTFDIVYKTLFDNSFSDELLHELFEKQRLDEQNKSFIKRLAFGTIERAIELRGILARASKTPVSKIDKKVYICLIMGMYEIYYMDNIEAFATCNEYVNLAKKLGATRLSGFVNGILRNVARNKDAFLPRKKWQKLSLPEKLYNHLVEQYGEKTTKKIATAFLTHSNELTVFVDTNKISLDEYCKLLDSDYQYEKSQYIPNAIKIKAVKQVDLLPGFSKGFIYIQNESSMLPVLVSGIDKDDTVVDICAAPGGKSVNALMYLNGTGFLSSRDVSQSKVKKIKDNFLRMNYSNCEAKVFDATNVDSEYENKADVILADVPCSGIGIIGHKPEIKYHALDNAKELVDIQKKICKASVRMLKQGGTFIYSTCTINVAENEKMVEWLEAECGLECESLDEFLPEVLTNKMTKNGMLQIIPGIHNMDGFFVARLKKRGN